mmetsp:Transcript_1965/g.5255  ORF Transcript_1965/g.5255 Transcript_1965/m.5255 type:complete len:288 (+) Transcript_1965:313-1176(+)
MRDFGACLVRVDFFPVRDYRMLKVRSGQDHPLGPDGLIEENVVELDLAEVCADEGDVALEPDVIESDVAEEGALKGDVGLEDDVLENDVGHAVNEEDGVGSDGDVVEGCFVNGGLPDLELAGDVEVLEDAMGELALGEDGEAGDAGLVERKVGERGLLEGDGARDVEVVEACLGNLAHPEEHAAGDYARFDREVVQLDLVEHSNTCEVQPRDSGILDVRALENGGAKESGIGKHRLDHGQPPEDRAILEEHVVEIDVLEVRLEKQRRPKHLEARPIDALQGDLPELC